MYQNENIQKLEQIRDFAHISCKCHSEKYQTIHQTNSNTKSKLERNTSYGVLPTKKALFNCCRISKQDLLFGGLKKYGLQLTLEKVHKA